MRVIGVSMDQRRNERRGKREIPEKKNPHRRAASSATIPTCENLGVNRPGIEPGAAVAERLACPPPTKANRARSPAGSLPDFRMWGWCRTMSLCRRVFSGFSLFPPLPLPFRRCSMLTSFQPTSALETSLNTLNKQERGRSVSSHCRPRHPHTSPTAVSASDRGDTSPLLQLAADCRPPVDITQRRPLVDNTYAQLAYTWVKTWRQYHPRQEPREERVRPYASDFESEDRLFFFCICDVFGHSRTNDSYGSAINFFSCYAFGIFNGAIEHFGRGTCNTISDITYILVPASTSPTGPSESLPEPPRRYQSCFCEKIFSECCHARQHERMACMKSPFRAIRHYDNGHMEIYKDSPTGSQHVMSIPPATSMGTVSADDYDETVNANDGQSTAQSVCAECTLARHSHEVDKLQNKRSSALNTDSDHKSPTKESKLGIDDKGGSEDDHEDSIDDNDYGECVDSEDDDDSFEVSTCYTNAFPSKSDAKKAGDAWNIDYMLPEDANEFVDRFGILIAMKRRGAYSDMEEVVSVITALKA
ncbi:hypothetical protein PR048_022471 [Dryococelus australis]|uniref:Uncharacterized protein n=1 Tax=Dryococelus australis TaxID=614101 RepID=A0ABQ9H138_9NEOP|nr:hypothetical protein PR048_022471 [Dryococelus australis]